MDNDKSTEKNDETKETLKNKLIEAVRKNPKKFLKKVVRKEYFRDENQENVILNILISGTGRKGRRSVAKELKVGWEEYLETENIVIEQNLNIIPYSVKMGWKERRYQQYQNGKISSRDFKISMLIIDQNMSYDDAEKKHDDYVKSITHKKKKK